jgi:hypothetical protein
VVFLEHAKTVWLTGSGCAFLQAQLPVQQGPHLGPPVQLTPEAAAAAAAAAGHGMAMPGMAPPSASVSTCKSQFWRHVRLHALLAQHSSESQWRSACQSVTSIAIIALPATTANRTRGCCTQPHSSSMSPLCLRMRGHAQHMHSTARNCVDQRHQALHCTCCVLCLLCLAVGAPGCVLPWCSGAILFSSSSSSCCAADCRHGGRV